MEVSGQFTPWNALFLEMDSKMPIGEEAGWAPELVWPVGRREKSLAPTEHLSPVVPVLTEISRFSLHIEEYSQILQYRRLKDEPLKSAVN
jgi:hypothetical protein